MSLQSNLPDGMRLGSQILTPRTAEVEEQIDLEPEPLTLITQKQQAVPQARGDSLPQPTENRETLIRRGSEQAAFARMVEKGQLCITSESVKDGNGSTTLCREYSEPRKSQTSRLQASLNDHVKLGAVTGVEAFISTRILFTEVPTPSREPGNTKSWVRISRGVEQHARQ